MIHIGQRIKEIFEQQPKDHTIEWFADNLHCKRSNIYNIFNRSTIDTDLLFNISKILDHDFFRDMTVELYSVNNRSRVEKHRLYEDIMHSIAQLLSKKLECFSPPDQIPYHYRLNDDDTPDSPLPPSEFIVSVKSGEDADAPPHIHVVSQNDRFEITYNLNVNSTTGRINIINYGNRPLNDPFSDIVHRINKWLEGFAKSKSGNIDNLTYATIAYNTLNSIY